ncbi:hypothetical protein C817_00085 [Dorea sp. 5-2]|nr:hypothetical protein C817_00085 [Dorea sp. 5-2]
MIRSPQTDRQGAWCAELVSGNSLFMGWILEIEFLYNVM